LSSASVSNVAKLLSAQPFRAWPRLKLFFLIRDAVLVETLLKILLRLLPDNTAQSYTGCDEKEVPNA
jgi:hypothetical protein